MIHFRYNTVWLLIEKIQVFFWKNVFCSEITCLITAFWCGSDNSFGNNIEISEPIKFECVKPNFVVKYSDMYFIINPFENENIIL